MKKKIVSITLALALMLSLALPAFAADTDSQDVTAKYEKTTIEEDVRSFELSWGELTFTYSETTEKTWNADNHTYTTETKGDWSHTATDITVVNHSNIELKVSMALTPVEGTGLTVTLEGGNATLEAGKEGQKDNAPSVTGKLKISGTPNETVTAEGIKVGSVTVTIE